MRDNRINWSPLRYPGGKTKMPVLDAIVARLAEAERLSTLQYREPFFGGGTLLNIIDRLPNLRSAWINDLDTGVACFWTSVIRWQRELSERVLATRLSVEEHRRSEDVLSRLNAMPQDKDSIIDAGLRRMILSWSTWCGRGGQPLGGYEQTGFQKVDANWSAENCVKRIEKSHKLLSKVHLMGDGCTNLDFAKVIEDDSCPSVLYLDPPYFDNANRPYRYGMTMTDHLRLRSMLGKTPHHWVLSYEDCEEARLLYGWSCIKEVNLVYRLSGRPRPAKELVITPRTAPCEVPSLSELGA